MSTSQTPSSTDAPDRNTSRRPEAMFRIGFVTASVFAHEVERDGSARVLHSVSIQRRYLDGETAKYSSSFGLSELPQAIRVLTLAQTYIEAREAQVVGAE